MPWYAKSTGAYDYLSDEGYANAYQMYGALTNAGYSIKSACAVIGNSYAEGGLNPWRWQSDDVPTLNEYANWTDEEAVNHGYGLFGFTPAKRYIRTVPASYSNFADRTGNVYDGQAQINFLINTDAPQNFVYSTDLRNYYYTPFQNIGVNIDRFYGMSLEQFKTGGFSWGNSVAELVGAFELQYEKPSASGATATYQTRVACAEYFYNLWGEDPPVPPPPPPPPILPPTVARWKFYLYG